MSNLSHLRKLTEELITKDKQIKESEELLRLALSSADAGAWTWNIELDVVNGTPKFYELFGNKISTFEEFINCIHPDDVNDVKCAVRNSIEHDSSYDINYRIKCEDKWKNVYASGKTLGHTIMTGICIENKISCSSCKRGNHA